MSCLAVCYANDPQKGGYTTPAPALDLTTSLRGDFDWPKKNLPNHLGAGVGGSGGGGVSDPAQPPPKEMLSC